MDRRKPVLVSVVMTTWNGNERILAQLLSIKNQTRRPDEVLIFDDGSSDGTAEAIRRFLDEHRLSHWKLYINPRNLGWKRNFMQALRQASGDYIFPCDQDDVWYPEKIEVMVREMEADPAILLLACDYRVLYEEGAIPAKVYKKTALERQGPTAKYGFTKHFFMNPSPGCSYGIRKSFFDEVNRLWFDEAPHDEFLWLMATIQDGAWFCNKTLMDYIRYEGNASAIRHKDIPMQLEHCNYISQMLDKLEQFALENPGKVKERYFVNIQTAQSWCKKRQNLLRTRNPIRWLLLAPWWGYYNSPKNCLSDLWLVLFGAFYRKRI